MSDHVDVLIQLRDAAIDDYFVPTREQWAALDAAIKALDAQSGLRADAYEQIVKDANGTTVRALFYIGRPKVPDGAVDVKYRPLIYASSPAAKPKPKGKMK